MTIEAFALITVAIVAFALALYLGRCKPPKPRDLTAFVQLKARINGDTHTLVSAPFPIGSDGIVRLPFTNETNLFGDDRFGILFDKEASLVYDLQIQVTEVP